MILIDRLTELREKLLLTQEDLASYIGVSVNTVNNWEHGFSTPQKKNLQSLAKALQTTTDYLEGDSEISSDYLSIGNKCIICGKSIPHGIAKCPECSWRKWTTSFLTSPEQATRRKRSHGVILSSLDREKARATFTSVTSYGVKTYETSLDMCTCPDFEERRKPCKHIFRLADELGLLKSESFALGERDYTMDFTRYESMSTSAKKSEVIAQESVKLAEPVKYLPAVVSESENLPHKLGIFLRLLKYAACCFFGAIAVLFVYGAFVDGRESPDLYCFPVAFVIAGILTASAANLKGEKSAFKWWLYGAVVPLVSWIEVTMLKSDNKVKAFMKGLACSLAGFVVFAIIASNFRPPMKPKESALPEVSPVVAVVPVPVSEDVKPEPKVSDDGKLTAEQAAYMAKLREQERESQLKREHGDWEISENQDETEHEEEAELKRKQEEYLKKANAVVVTPKGKKYHKPNCRTVRGSSRTLTIAQARKRGYTPCKVCGPPSSPVTLENSRIYWGDDVYTSGRKSILGD